jgi:hypothetical protein
MLANGFSNDGIGDVANDDCRYNIRNKFITLGLWFYLR